MRTAPDNRTDGGPAFPDRLILATPGMREREFLHSDRIPLDQVDLSTDEERGQGMLMVCEAGCGL